MSIRPEKQAIVSEIHQQLAGGSYVLVVDYMGLSVGKLTDLRARLRGPGARLQVVSNAFFRHAASRMAWQDVSALLTGPSAMVSGAGDVTVTAKVLKDFIRDNKLPVLKGGMLGNRLLTAEDVASLAALPPREVLLARLVGTLAAPMSQLAGVLRQKTASLVYVLKAIEEKKNKA